MLIAMPFLLALALRVFAQKAHQAAGV